MLKVAYNVFGCFRTVKGADGFSMMQSVFETGRKQGKSPKEIVSSVFNGKYLDIFNDECLVVNPVRFITRIREFFITEIR